MKSLIINFEQYIKMVQYCSEIDVHQVQKIYDVFELRFDAIDNKYPIQTPKGNVFKKVRYCILVEIGENEVAILKAINL